jgi:hypothetical protein
MTSSLALPRTILKAKQHGDKEGILEPFGTNFCSFDQNDAVTLHVGPSEHTILAHTDFISRDSEFFKAALKKDWVEGKTRIIKLPDECPKVFTHYLNYVYCKRLPTKILITKSGSTFVKDSAEHYQLLVKLYVLGERLLDDSVRDAVLLKIVRLTYLFEKSSYPVFAIGEAVNIVYRGTPVGSPARRLMVDCHVAHGTDDSFDSTCDADFVLEVVQTLIYRMRNFATVIDMRSHSDPRKRKYHV